VSDARSRLRGNGKVKRINSSRLLLDSEIEKAGTTAGSIGFEGTQIPLAEFPDKRFEPLLSHANYNALYSLVLVAATNRYDLRIRALEDIVPERDEQFSGPSPGSARRASAGWCDRGHSSCTLP
jgi:hypothetical protein